MSSDGTEVRFPEERLAQGDVGYTRSNLMARAGNWQPQRRWARFTLRAGRYFAKPLLYASVRQSMIVYGAVSSNERFLRVSISIRSESCHSVVRMVVNGDFF